MGSIRDMMQTEASQRRSSGSLLAFACMCLHLFAKQIPRVVRCTHNKLKRLQHKPYQLLNAQHGASETNSTSCMMHEKYAFLIALLMFAFLFNYQNIAYMLGPGGRGVRVQMKCECMVEP